MAARPYAIVIPSMTIVIFAGAGASKAVNPREYPATVEFFERLPETIKSQAIFKRVLEYLTSNSEKTETVDVERILWVLRELDAFIGQAADARSVPGWFLRGDRLGVSANLSNLLDPAPTIRQKVSALVDHINARVYDFYARPPEKYELETNWLALLRPLLGSRQPIELFTTNYDINIEVALQILKEDNSIQQQIQTGRGSGVYPLLDESLWARGVQELPRPVGLLTKLHGSVDWSRGSQGIFVGDPLYKGSHEKQVILYPGFKGTPAVEPFALFHHYLAGAVAKASAIIFIGFAFRDDYINQILSRFTSSYAKLYIIDPAESLPGVPYPQERVMHLKSSFSESIVAISRILNALIASNRGA